MYNVYKEYRSHRPFDLLKDESRFYLRPLPNPQNDILVWHSKLIFGQDKLGRIMKVKAEKGNLQERQVNHSERRKKTFAATLLQRGKPIRGFTTWRLEKYWVVKPLFCPFIKTTRGSIPYYFQCNDPRPQYFISCV